jgi:hypothetical protein
MHATSRRAAIQAVRTVQPVIPLRQLLDGAVLRSSHASSPTSANCLSAIQPGAVPKGCSTACQSIFYNTRDGILECNNRQAWVDLRRGYCHLCQEPIGVNAGNHVSERDHTNLQLFLYLYAAYPRRDFLGEAAAADTAGQRAVVEVPKSRRGGIRTTQSGDGGVVGYVNADAATASLTRTTMDNLLLQEVASSSSSTTATRLPTNVTGTRAISQDSVLWRAEDVLRGVRGISPALHRFATEHRTTDQLHTGDDAARRAELEALLFYLTHPPHQVLSHALQGKSPLSFWVSGEKVWKYEMTRLISQIFPPMSAGMMTNFTQKCWSRTNQECLYDALQLQRMKSYYGWGPYASKEKKAFFVRQLIFELLLSEVRPELSETARLLAAQAARRMAFELVFLKSMEYMQRVQRVHELMGRPTVADLKGLNLL